MKYVYPAIFFPEGDGRHNVIVPDLPGCRTFGDDIADAIDMARDAVSMWLCDAEDKNEPIPKPSEHPTVECPPEGFVSLVDADTLEYRRENDNRAIKKTLSVPRWLNAKAEKAGVNFSQLLQAALLNYLGIENRDPVKLIVNRTKTTREVQITPKKIKKA